MRHVEKLVAGAPHLTSPHSSFPFDIFFALDHLHPEPNQPWTSSRDCTAIEFHVSMSPASSEAPSRASLLGLPSEIRLRIYKFVFSGSQINLSWDPGRSDLTEHDRISPPCYSYSDGLTKTHSLLRCEALPVLLDSTVLSIRASSPFVYNSIYLTLPSSIISQIKKLSIDDRSSGPLPLHEFTSLEFLELQRVHWLDDVNDWNELKWPKTWSKIFDMAMKFSRDTNDPFTDRFLRVEAAAKARGIRMFLRAFYCSQWSGASGYDDKSRVGFQPSSG